MSDMPQLSFFSELDLQLSSFSEQDFLTESSRILDYYDTDTCKPSFFPDSEYVYSPDDTNTMATHTSDSISPLNFFDSFNLAEEQNLNYQDNYPLLYSDSLAFSPVFPDLCENFSQDSQFEQQLSEEIDPSTACLSENNPLDSLSPIPGPVLEETLVVTDKDSDTSSLPGTSSSILTKETEILIPEAEVFESESTQSGKVLSISIPNKSPIKIVVKKVQNHSSPKMVAPAKIPEPKVEFVRIPSSGNINSQRISHIQKNEKLAAIQKANFSHSKSIFQNTTKRVRIPKITSDKNNVSTTTDNLEIKSGPSISETSLSTKDQSLNLDNLPFTSLKRQHTSTDSCCTAPKKVKAYELEPLPDPSMEKCRRNAINAKKNRDIQKAKMIALEAAFQAERVEKCRLAGEIESLRKKQAELEERLKRTELLVDPKKLPVLENANGYKCIQMSTSTEDILNAQCHPDMQIS